MDIPPAPTNDDTTLVDTLVVEYATKSFTTNARSENMKISVALLGLAATANALELTPDVSRRLDSSGVRNMLSLALARDGHHGIASVNTSMLRAMTTLTPLSHSLSAHRALLPLSPSLSPPQNWEAETSGKTIFVKFLAPW